MLPWKQNHNFAARLLVIVEHLTMLVVSNTEESLAEGEWQHSWAFICCRLSRACSQVETCKYQKLKLRVRHKRSTFTTLATMAWVG